MYKLLVAIAVAFAAVSPASAADIIVESRAGGKNYEGYREPEGRWLDSNTPANTAKSSAPDATQDIGGRKTTVTPGSGVPADQVLSAARFTPPITEDGTYHVYVTYPRAANATPITYVIKHANGEDKVQATQDGWGSTAASKPNTWVHLGSFPFSSGGNQYVELQVTGATGGADTVNPPQAFADAVRFSTEALTQAQEVGTALPGRTPDPSRAPARAATPAPVQWATSLTTARSQASTAGKKVFIYFYSPGSSRSTDYEKVLQDPAVQTTLNRDFVAVRINMDVERTLSNQLQVFRAGTIAVYDGRSGAALGQITDTPPARELISRLASF